MDNTYTVDNHAVIVLLFFKRNTKNPLAHLPLLAAIIYMVNQF